MADRALIRRAWMAGAVLLVAATVVYSAAVHTENVIETYPTHADALRGGARNRGWLPGFVPSTATAIREVHNLDSGEQWLRFALPPAELDALAARILAIPTDKTPTWHRRPPRWSGSWVRVTGAADPQSISHHRTGERGRVWCMVLDRRDSTVYGWTCGAES